MRRISAPRASTQRTLALACGLSFLVGCIAANTATTDPKPAGGADASRQSSGPVELKIVSAAELTQAIQSHAGQVVVADLWFLGCAPCVKKFPEFVAMQRELANEGIVCISIDCMPSEADLAPKVLDFLKKQNASFPNYLLKDQEQIADQWLERHGVVETPTVLIFNKQGEQVKRLTDAPMDRVKKLARELN